MTSFNFVVGTFNTPSLYTLAFTPSTSSLKILRRHDAIGSHSWLALSKNKKNLYATAWTEPSTVAAYSIDLSDDIKLLNTAPTKSRSGYVCCSDSYVYSAGGATGEVFAINASNGSLSSGSASTSTSTSESAIAPVQNLDFVSNTTQRDNGSTMDFGGLRHGAHSADLSPDGSIVYIADIGRNCIWSYSISQGATPHLKLIEKHISPRGHDGPRHCWPHPNGRILYVLQEHSSMVDVFIVSSEDQKLTHVQGVRIVPKGIPVSNFWADEVRTSLSSGSNPKYLYASTRGLKEGQKGFVAVYALKEDGMIDGATVITEPGSEAAKDDQDQGGLLDMYETATSGGWANAVEPGPTIEGLEYLALTDSEKGLVFVLGWNGSKIQEVARVDLNEVRGENDEGVVGAATAIWL